MQSDSSSGCDVGTVHDQFRFLDLSPSTSPSTSPVPTASSSTSPSQSQSNSLTRTPALSPLATLMSKNLEFPQTKLNMSTTCTSGAAATRSSPINAATRTAFGSMLSSPSSSSSHQSGSLPRRSSSLASQLPHNNIDNNTSNIKISTRPMIIPEEEQDPADLHSRPA
ncbi:hypothetical protein HDU76_008844, partial [Blyttiomyces sp. JEL0837]